VKNDLLAIPAVAEVNDLHIWETGSEQRLLSVHLKSSGESSDHTEIIRTAREMLNKKHGINHPTIQVLPASADEMEHCNHCN